MAALGWDHNAFYHRLLLRQLPGRCGRALDVGCGAGAFAAELAQRVKQVNALDISPVMIEATRQRTPSNVNCLLADVLHDPLPAETYDAIFSISALHHMPLQDALPRLAATLRPGGVLAAVSLPRPDLPRELPVEFLAAVGQRILATTFAAARLVGGGSWFAQDPVHAAMPVVLDPPLTTREVRKQAGALLPGVRVRRLLFWRYLLLWRKPANQESADRQVVGEANRLLIEHRAVATARTPLLGLPGGYGWLGDGRRRLGRLD